MSAGVVGFALILLVAIMLAGKYLRVKLKFLQKILLPSSIIAGILALVAGDQVISRLADVINWDWLADGGLFTEDIYTVWSSLPGLLISVVFATLFLGARIPKPGRVVKLAGPQLSIGIAYGSGQYVVGLLLAVLILAPLFDVDEKFGALIEIAFEGGHGTAAGMQPAFDDVGMPEATDLALAMATVGLVAGIIVGMGFLNWAVRKGKTQVIKNIDQQSESELQGLYTSDEQVSAGKQTARPNSIEPLTLHMAVVGVAIIIGWLLLELITWIENMLWGQPDSVFVSEGDGTTLLGYIPLFPLAMIGGVIVQLFLDKTGRTELIDHEMMKRIQGLGLDLLIASALATISLSVIADYWQAFVLLSVVG
ncbi:sodium/glutamate symporter, partial [Corynebacterium propinquum]|uniref:sodium/glutamate symporter n=1 Tax=Corynebacterium propinquum TaxID=43769 RepID=UPI002541482E